MYVVTDSAANLPGDLVAELGLTVVPLHLTIGDRTFRDGVDIVMSEFYEQLQTGEEVASTSAPSMGDFLEAFRAIPGGDEVVCVTVAADVSATNQAAHSTMINTCHCPASDQSRGRRFFRTGRSTGLMAPPTAPIMFMNPATVPACRPPMSVPISTPGMSM